MTAVRRATRDDLAAIVALYEADSLQAGREPSRADRTEAFEEIDRDPRQLLLVAEHDGRVVGTLQLTILRHLTYGGARVGLIEAVHVAQGERSRGIGSEMMRVAIARARELGCNRVQL